MSDRATGSGVGVRPMEIATALAFAAIGGLAVWDSVRIGASWGSDGPRSGYFPFWLGIILIASGLGTLLAALRHGGQGVFVRWEQFGRVASVLVPTAIYVAAIPFLGIYAASAVLVAWFMIVLGGFAWWRAVPGGVTAALVAFIIFEFWFLVPLPKGPIEHLLGF